MGIKSYPVIDMVATGKNIVRLRKAHGYTVAELQEFFGFDAPQAIYKWQQGKTLPSTDNLFALSQFLGVNMEDILVAEKPKFQVLPQEESCGSDFLAISFDRRIFFTEAQQMYGMDRKGVLFYGFKPFIP